MHTRPRQSGMESMLAIEVEDEGKGIDPAKMREVAVRKNLLNPEEAKNLDDRDALELIFMPGFSSADITGHLSLVNTFASWCTPCRTEHPVLTALAATKRVAIYGIDYKDKEEAALAWIAALGNPYTRIGADNGRVGIDWGVYGVPETFVVDRLGRIRYKHVGPLTQADLDRTILPLVAQLER